MNKNIIIYKDIIAFHPVVYIKDLGFSEKELADAMRMTIAEIKALFNGEIDIDKELAIKLEKISGIRSKVWMELQNTYNKKMKEIEEKKKEEEKDRQLEERKAKQLEITQNGHYFNIKKWLEKS